MKVRCDRVLGVILEWDGWQLGCLLPFLGVMVDQMSTVPTMPCDKFPGLGHSVREISIIISLFEDVCRL